jgi:DNA-binding LacI/PurR family transcriptional regulator
MDGVLVYICEPESRDLAALDRRGLPQVAIDQNKRDGVPGVNVDDRGGARAAAQHVVDLGHTRVGILALEVTSGDPERNYPSRERMLGWREPLEAAAIEPVVRTVGYRPAGDAQARAVELLTAADRPTAILCFSDAFAMGAIRAAESLGLRVPEDVSVVGFDDSPLAAASRPPLTTVHQEVASKGQAAVSILVSMMGGAGTPDDVLLPTSLVVRDSTAAPPA